jgi:hypothetical protein
MEIEKFRLKKSESLHNKFMGKLSPPYMIKVLPKCEVNDKCFSDWKV